MQYKVVHHRLRHTHIGFHGRVAFVNNQFPGSQTSYLMAASDAVMKFTVLYIIEHGKTFHQTSHIPFKENRYMGKNTSSFVNACQIAMPSPQKQT